MTVDSRSIVVIGGGHAGGAMALALRELGATCAITIVGEETLAPYERPSLSKEMLSGEAEAPVYLAPPEKWSALDVKIRLGTKALGIDRAKQRVLLENGAALPYETLVLATGGTAKQIPGSVEVGATILRTATDALTLRKRAAACRSALVLGGGLIGLEVAASMRQAGLAVDLVGAEPCLAARCFPRAASDWIAAIQMNGGVRLHLGSPVISLRRVEGGIEAQLANGKCLVSELVIQGLGIEPNTELAAAAGLACRNGIFVDHNYRTVTDPRIFAIGDVATRFTVDGRQQPRDESWSHARGSAAIAARAILSLARGPEEAPWFWTSQFSHVVQVAGDTGSQAVAVPRGDRVVLYVNDGRLAGAACLDTPKDFLVARRAIAAGQSVDARRAADPAVDLRKCFLTHTDPISRVAL